MFYSSLQVLQEAHDGQSNNSAVAVRSELFPTSSRDVYNGTGRELYGLFEWSQKDKTENNDQWFKCRSLIQASPKRVSLLKSKMVPSTFIKIPVGMSPSSTGVYFSAWNSIVCSYKPLLPAVCPARLK